VTAGAGAAAAEPRRRPTGTDDGAPRPRVGRGWGGLRSARRHPGDVLRVLAGSLVAAAGALAAHCGHVFAFDANLFRLVNQLPDVLGQPLLVAMQLGVVGAVPVVAAAALAARRPRLARDLALSGGLAWVLAKVVKDVVGEARPVALLQGVVERAVHTGLGYPSGHVAVAAALATAAGPWLPRPARRATWWAVWLVARRPDVRRRPPAAGRRRRGGAGLGGGRRRAPGPGRAGRPPGGIRHRGGPARRRDRAGSGPAGGSRRPRLGPLRRPSSRRPAVVRQGGRP